MKGIGEIGLHGEVGIEQTMIGIGEIGLQGEVEIEHIVKTLHRVETYRIEGETRWIKILAESRKLSLLLCRPSLLYHIVLSPASCRFNSNSNLCTSKVG